MLSKSKAKENQPGPDPKRAKASKEIKMKIFNDSIHGHIELHPLLVKIIDTPQFQRLRNIKQLGGKYLIFPGASHNRFEHSLGVAHLAGCLVKSLKDKQPELDIDDCDVLCVQIAGLCHDLGHGPLSHLFDGKFIPKALKNEGWTNEEREKLKKWTHEEMSVKIFKDIVKTLKEDVFKEHELDFHKDVKFIGELIQGKGTSGEDLPRAREKSFLYEIVANEQNKIDVDKWDYFARDCHHLGISNNFDHLRLLKFARVCKCEDGEKHICFRDKEADNVYDMFRTRYTLHRQAYQHKIGNIIEEKFTEVLLKADRDLHMEKPEDMFKISKTIISDTLDDYLKLTDNIFEQIMNSTHATLKDSREILNNIANRKLPKFVGEARLTDENRSKIGPSLRTTMEENWKRAIKNNSSLKKESFSVYVDYLDHSMKSKNPIEKVYFYNKWDDNKGCKAKKYQVSSFLPKNFNEELVRVYCENPDIDSTVMQEAVKCFQKWCESNFGLPSKIVFYEDKYFQGEKFMCDSNFPDLQTKLKRCSSIYVERGTWVLYESNNYTGVKYVLTPGEYPNYQLWKGPQDLCCCKIHSRSSSEYKIQIFERSNFEGNEAETTVDCPSVQNRFGMKDVLSCKVLNGAWMLSGDPERDDNFQLIEPEYRSPEWNFQVKSLKCLTE